MADLPLTVTIQGQIKDCITTIANNIYCRYVFTYGRDWSIGHGSIEGVTQTSKRGKDNNCVFNFPLNVSFRSSKPFGWPQLVVALYGRNTFGNDMIVGYGAIHVPAQVGHHELEVPLFKPDSASLMQSLIGFFSGITPEYIDMKFISGGSDREVTKTKSQGMLNVEFDVLMGGLQKLDLIIQKTE